MIQRSDARTCRCKSKTSGGQRQREFVIVYDHDSVHDVHLRYCHTHFNRQQQSSGTSEKSDQQKQSAKRFQYTRDIHELSRQSMLYKHRPHSRIGVRQFGVAVREENYTEGNAEKQQAERLK